MVNSYVLNVILDGLSIFCLVFFSLDVFLSIWTVPQYFISFRILFDGLATASLAFCIPIFTSNLVDQVLEVNEWNEIPLRIVGAIRSLQLIRFWKLVDVCESLLGPPLVIGETMSRMMLQELVVFVLLSLIVVPEFTWPSLEPVPNWYSLSRSLCVGAVLVISNFYLFAPKKAFEAILRPIDTMMEKVDMIRRDPMATDRGDKERRSRDMARITQLARLDTASGWWGRWRVRRELAAAMLVDSSSVDMLEKTIEQIGGLLAVSFGAAGARIVAENMKNLDTMQIHAMVPGRRIEAIFGHFCIQDFARLTSVLEDKVLLFVNQVCDIVHGIVDEFHGIPNRSNGDSFLVVWTGNKETVLADLAVAACAKIQIAINRSIELWEYGRLPSLIGFRVQLHMGLHRGWAIEGAIGSNLKIDPTYLSPDVNTAQQLQETNKQRETTTLLVSDVFLKSCSKKIQTFFRQIDIHIFSFDIRVFNLLSPYETEHAIITGPRSESPNINVNTKLGQHRIRMDRELRKEAKWTTDLADMLLKDRYFRAFQFDDENFKALFQKGYLNYECGEWAIAKEALEEATVIRPKDGPSRFLLKHMSN